MPRNQDEDDDDRPRPRRRPNRDDDEFDDDRPRTRRPSNREVEDDDDDRPRVRRRTSLDDDDDLPRRRSRSRSRPKTQQISNLGVLSLSTGILALILSFTCFGSFAVIPGLVGLVLGIIGFVVAQKSNGRQSPLLPIGGSVVSLAAMVVSVIAIYHFARGVKEFRDEIKDGAARWEKDRAERKDEMAKAAVEVKNAIAPIRLTAIQFARAYDKDEDRADALYMNKILEITGTIKEVDFVNDDEAYIVILVGGAEDEVHCLFSKDASTRARLAQLKPGAPVTIRGRCPGGGLQIEACIFP